MRRVQVWRMMKGGRKMGETRRRGKGRILRRLGKRRGLKMMMMSEGVVDDERACCVNYCEV